MLYKLDQDPDRRQNLQDYKRTSLTGYHLTHRNPCGTQQTEEAKPQLSSTKEMPGYVPHGILSAHLIDIKIKSSTDVAG